MINIKQLNISISRCRFGVFSRTHASIAAYSTGVPTIVLGYSTKAKGIAKDMGVEDYVIDISEIKNNCQLCQRFKELYEYETQVKTILINNSEKMKKMAYDMFKYLE